MADEVNAYDVGPLVFENNDKTCVITGKRKVFVLVFSSVLLLLAIGVTVATLAVVGKEPLENDSKDTDSQNHPAYLYILSDEEANKTGAYCLDGSPPAYYIRKGSGAGNSSWIVWLEGGGSCTDLTACYRRSFSRVGSSKGLRPNTTLEGILSAEKDINPDFYTWNVVYMVYCDGFFYAGNRQDVVRHNGRSLYFRGRRNLNALIGHLLATGMAEADRVILGGYSAGAVGMYVGADDVISRMPSSVNVKILADSGMFMNIPDKDGIYSLKEKYITALELHNGTESINKACLESQAPSENWKCYFSENLVRFQPAPTFILNCLYDNIALYAVLKTTCRPDQCQGNDLIAVQNYRTTLLQVVESDLREHDGAFLITCFEHVIYPDRKWTIYKVNGTSARQAVADWYFGRAPDNVHADMGTDLNPTCNNT